MSCGYLLDILPFILDGFLRETQIMTTTYFQCMMIG